MYNGVQAFRLISGEDVFGTVKHFDENSFLSLKIVAKKEKTHFLFPFMVPLNLSNHAKNRPKSS